MTTLSGWKDSGNWGCNDGNSHEKQEELDTYEARFDDMDESMELLNRELWIILIQKTEKEAYKKVSSVTTGEGLFVFVRLNDWFSKRNWEKQTE